jgi:TRAP-type uncharacterized transport system fused permease subunit
VSSVCYFIEPVIKSGPERIEVFIWACMGLYALAGILQWHLETRINAPIAAALLVSAGLLMWTPLPIYYHFAGASILVAVVLLQKRSTNIESAATNPTNTSEL